MLAIHPKKSHSRINMLSDRAGDDGFAQPREPIPIILARDEELGLVNPTAEESEHEVNIPTPPPPAYGLWRCSVVCVPRSIFILHNFSPTILK